MLFKNLIAAPQRDAYNALGEKLAAAKEFRPPEPLSAHATLVAVRRHVEHVEDLLEEREVLLNREGGMYRERTIDWLERRIDESVAAARLLVRNQVFHRLRFFLCVIRIQRTVLRILYAPREGNVPRISRSLLDETFMALGDGDADDDG